VEDLFRRMVVPDLGGRSFRRMVATYPVTVYARRPFFFSDVRVVHTEGPVRGTHRQRSNTVRLYYIWTLNFMNGLDTRWPFLTGMVVFQPVIDTGLQN
jgi:hypothetical protein